MEPVDVARLDRVIHEPARLAIASVLATRRDMPFTELRDLLEMTDGNLSVHLGKLEEAGFVVLTKEFVGKRPRTTVKLTRAGRTALRHHLDALESIVRAARRAPADPE
jgi:DNA-binding transcriptional ArsR family regulator